MKLNADDKPWAPQDRPDYLCLLKPGQPPPASDQQFLQLQARLLLRLWNQANRGEKENANLMFQNNLAPEVLDALPSGLFLNPRTCRQLFDNPALEGKPPARVEVGVRGSGETAPMPDREAREEAEQLSLESFLGRLL